MKRIFGLLLVLIASLPAAHAQELLTPQKCVDLVVERALTVKQQGNTVQTAVTQYFQSKMAFLPTVNAAWDYRLNFGTSFDLFAFQRVNQTTGFSSPALQVSLPVWDGLQRLNTYKQQGQNVLATQAGLKNVINDAINNMLVLYLQIVTAQNTLAITQNRITVLQEQRDRLNKLYLAGSITQADVLNLDAQIASENVTYLQQKNALERNKLLIIQALQLDPLKQYTFSAPDTSALNLAGDVLPDLGELIITARKTSPELEELQYRVQAAKFNVKSIKAGYYPSLNVNFGLSSNYSSNGGQFVADPITGQPSRNPDGTLKLNRTEYFSQLEDNFNQSISFSLSVPIFNNFRVRTNVQLAEINIMNTELSYQLAADNLTREVQQAYLDVVAAKEQYGAILQQITAAQAAFDQTELQYNAGKATLLSYQQALNTLTTAQQQKTVALYDYFFKRKLIDFYLGKPITF